MEQAEFERLLTQALIRSATETWITHPSEESLQKIYPNTKTLDERVRQIVTVNKPAVDNRIPLYRRVRQCAAMVFLTMSILFGALMLHPEARQIIINIVVTWYEDHIKYSFQNDDSTAIPQNWDFGYIPKDFTLVFERCEATFCLFQYERPDGAFLEISISNESGVKYTDNEHYEITQDVIRGDAADVYRATGTPFSSMVVWHRDELKAFVTIIGDVPAEELISVLECRLL